MPSDILKGKKLSIGFDPNLFTKNSLSILFGKSECKYIPLKKNLIDKIWKRKIKNKKVNFTNYLIRPLVKSTNSKLIKL